MTKIWVQKNHLGVSNILNTDYETTMTYEDLFSKAFRVLMAVRQVFVYDVKNDLDVRIFKVTNIQKTPYTAAYVEILTWDNKTHSRKLSDNIKVVIKNKA